MKGKSFLFSYIERKHIFLRYSADVCFKSGSKGMSMEAATVLRETMLGVKFLHDMNWIHGDLKPQNIGILRGKPLRAVILDVGQATELALGSKLPAMAGCGGTVNYLAPERELTEYDHGVDVWPLAVIGYELTYGYHPFKFNLNP